MPKPNGYQLHHIIPKSLFDGANPHDIFKLSGYDVNDIRNLIYLLTSRDNHPTRSVHRGFNSHHKIYNGLKREALDRLVEMGSENNWTSKQYHSAMKKLINKERQKLRTGKTRLHCEG